MITFTDLINKGVAPSPYQTNIVGGDITNYDPFVINYNNIWGVVTDTHMSKGDNNYYYISGSLISDYNKTRSLFYDTHVGNYYFNNSSLGTSTLYEFLRNFRKKAKRMVVNGDWVIVIEKMSEEQCATLDNQAECTIQNEQMYIVQL